MRDKTGVIFGDGLSGFVELFHRAFIAGNVAIIYDDKKVVDKLLPLLDKALYNVTLYSIDKISVLPEFVKAIIGVGDDFLATKIKPICKNKTYCHYATFPILSCFSRYDLYTGVPYEMAEFVYYDSPQYDLWNTKIVFDVYQNLFCVLSECIFLSYYESVLPFLDRGIFGVIDGIKKLLIKGCDRENFFKESARLIKVGMEYLNLREQKIFIGYKILKAGKMSRENMFGVYYFINSLLLSFTKWDFFDMLIPSQRLVSGINCERPNLRGEAEGQLLSRNDLKIVARKAQNLIELPKFDWRETIKLLEQTVEIDTPLLAEINNRGILEGLLWSI